MKAHLKRVFYLILIFFVLHICFTQVIFAGDLNFREVFGSNWIKAEKFVSENKNWMEEMLQESRIDFRFAVSVIFPELVRYSAIRDRMEITLLKALYVHYGTDYANFSVGVFQVKPSCAQEVLHQIPALHDRKFSDAITGKVRLLHEKERRSAIIRDMEDPKSQFRYVAAIIRLLDKKYANRNWGGEETKLKFFATAYNCGFSNTDTYIWKQIGRKSFHTELVRSDRKYCYSDIAAYYFRHSAY